MTSYAKQLILEAIKRAGTTETGPVCLALEDIYREKSKHKYAAYVFKGLKRMGFKTYSDVEKAIQEVTNEQIA